MGGWTRSRACLCLTRAFIHSCAPPYACLHDARRPWPTCLSLLYGARVCVCVCVCADDTHRPAAVFARARAHQWARPLQLAASAQKAARVSRRRPTACRLASGFRSVAKLPPFFSTKRVPLPFRSPPPPHGRSTCHSTLQHMASSHLAGLAEGRGAGRWKAGRVTRASWIEFGLAGI